MLYLHPPFHIINGVSVFADHADPLQFYFLPLAPKLTVLTDPGSGERIPQIQLIRYRGSAGNGGILNFDVNVGISDDELADVATELRSRMDVDGEPRLAPVPLVDGTVRLLIFGEDSGAEEDGDEDEEEPTGPRFVLKIAHHAKPSLFGDNQAAFSVMLDEAGVVVMEKGLKGEIAPIAVVYSLEYLALRPAYTVQLTADWNRVQEHLEKSFGFNTLIFSAQIDDVVDKLIEDRTIQITADTFVDESDDSGVISRRDQALNEVREMVTDTFFQPSVDPIDTGDGDFADTVERLSQIGSRGGLQPLFTWKNVDIKRIDQKHLNVHMSERTSVRRGIHPQGHLSGIFRSVIEAGLDLERFIIPVDLDDPYFQKRKVHVRSIANFQGDSIALLNASLTYGGDRRNVILENQDSKADLEWSSLFEGGAMKREVEASLEVDFRDVDGTERPLSMRAELEPVTGDELVLIPRENLYSIVPVTLDADRIPWERYPEVEVQVRYADSENRIDVQDYFTLNQALDQTGQTPVWKLFVADPARKRFEYKLNYRAADNRDIEGPWTESEEDRIRIPDPSPGRRKLDVVTSSGLWLELDRVFVDLRYVLPDGTIGAEGSLQFSQTDAAPVKQFVIEKVDPAQPRITYKVTLIYRDGRVFEVPQSYTVDQRIMIRADMRGHQVVTVYPEALDFDQKNLTEIKVELRFVDDGLSFADTFNFRSAQARAAFEFDYVDPARREYEYKATWQYANGLSRGTPDLGTPDALKSSVADLEIPVD